MEESLLAKEKWPEEVWQERPAMEGVIDED